MNSIAIFGLRLLATVLVIYAVVQIAGYPLFEHRCQRYCFVFNVFQLLLPSHLVKYGVSAFLLAFAAFFWWWSQAYKSAPSNSRALQFDRITTNPSSKKRKRKKK
jgi:MFS superfamily sulfate permease-like transporter